MSLFRNLKVFKDERGIEEGKKNTEPLLILLLWLFFPQQDPRKEHPSARPNLDQVGDQGR